MRLKDDCRVYMSRVTLLEECPSPCKTTWHQMHRRGMRLADGGSGLTRGVQRQIPR